MDRVALVESIQLVSACLNTGAQVFMRRVYPGTTLVKHMDIKQGVLSRMITGNYWGQGQHRWSLLLVADERARALFSVFCY